MPHAPRAGRGPIRWFRRRDNPCRRPLYMRAVRLST
jgi:hypothetical protein